MRTLDIKRFLKLFVITACAGAVIIGYSYYAISSGAAFNTFIDWCTRSQSVAAVVGQFQNTELVFLGGSGFEKDKGETGSAGFKARIVGSKMAVVADVKMKRQGDLWTIEQVLISGKALDTNDAVK